MHSVCVGIDVDLYDWDKLMDGEYGRNEKCTPRKHTNETIAGGGFRTIQRLLQVHIITTCTQTHSRLVPLTDADTLIDCCCCFGLS